MRFLVTAHDARTQRRATTHIEVDATATVREIHRLLVTANAADISGADRGIAIDGLLVHPDTLVRDSGLRDGSWITLLGDGDTPRARASRIESAAQLRVVSGVGAGTTFHLGSGAITIGRSGHATIHTEQARIHQVLLEVRVDPVGNVIAIPHATVAETAQLHDAPVTRPVQLTRGDQLVFTDCVLELGYAGEDRAAVEADPESGAITYNRPPRILPPEPEPVFRLPSLPAEPQKQPLPLVSALLPLLMGITMAYAFHNPRMLLFGLFSPLMLISSFITRKRFGQKRYRAQLADYEEQRRRIEADARQAVVDERARRRRLGPDPCELARIAVAPTARLWERRLVDPHWLDLRFGTKHQQSSVTLEDPEELEHRRVKQWEVYNVPVTVNLREAGRIGIAGTGRSAQQLAQWAIAQVAVLHSPRDAQVYLLSGNTDARNPLLATAWDFLAWIPHAKPAAGQDALRTIATNTQSLATRLAELAAILDSRADEMRQNSMSVWAGSSLVVVIDGAHRLRSMPGVVRILREGPAVGIFSLCLDTDERLLPEECETVVLAERNCLTIRKQRSSDETEILPDWVSDAWCDWVARGIAPIVDSSPHAADAAIPASSRLLDVLQLDPPTPDEVRARWLLNPRSTRAVIGESLDGAFALDLAADGPHGLIAGTTGSGKSELLQTIVAALAVANTSENMTFVLVDYKGGAAFTDCVDLPHTVGMVTDLDTHLVARALDSLGAELKYREHVLGEAGAKDIEDYLDLVGRTPELPRMPRLLIVIDEFASLARELPNFVTGLVNIAQRGRSLGIHLLLATQRPSGVVSPEIRANTNLRIALRVTDAGESSDVINSADAAHIAKSTPGRAYVRLGSQSLIPFQAGRVGGRAPAPADAAEQQHRAPLVRPLSFPELAGPPPSREPAPGRRDAPEATDLRLLVAAIRDAHRDAGFAQPRQPWLPALGTEIVLDEVLRRFGPQEASDAPEIWFGVEDLLGAQRQRPLAFAPDTDGHLYLVGTSRSGKTTAMRTLALSIAQTLTAAEAHIHVIDCGNGGLLPLRGLPHTGTVVQRHQAEAVSRLLRVLREETTRRQKLLSEHGCANLRELTRALETHTAPAHLFLLIDSWDGFLTALESAEGGELVGHVQHLLREGAAAGIHVVISGDRQLIMGRMALLNERKIVMRLVEKTDFTQIGVNTRTVPDELPEGRAFSSDGGTEVQFALVCAGTNSQRHAEHIALVATQLVERDREVPQDRRPLTIAEMPLRVTLAEAESAHGTLTRRDGDIFLGVGGQKVQPCVINPRQGTATFVIAGPPKSGRTTTLLAVTRGALAAGYEVVLAVPRKNPLRDLAEVPGVLRVFRDAEELTEEALTPLLVRDRPTLLIADDAELLRTFAAELWLRTTIPDAQELGLGFIVAGDTAALGKGMTGWLVEVRKQRHGLLFSPASLSDGDVTGVRLKRSDIGAALPAGRGHFTDETGAAMLLQVALPTPALTSEELTCQ